MNKDLKLKKMERDLLDKEISVILMGFLQDYFKQSKLDKLPDFDLWSRKIVAHCREQIQ